MTTYEWTTEEIDEHGDIINSNFSDKLRSFSREDFNSCSIGLVRDTGNEIEGLTDRCWAYIKDGKLPEFFSNSLEREIGIKVPKRFHKELKNYLK